MHILTPLSSSPPLLHSPAQLLRRIRRGGCEDGGHQHSRRLPGQREGHHPLLMRQVRGQGGRGRGRGKGWGDSSPDSLFQGREKDIVLFSSVRLGIFEGQGQGASPTLSSLFPSPPSKVRQEGQEAERYRICCRRAARAHQRDAHALLPPFRLPTLLGPPRRAGSRAASGLWPMSGASTWGSLGPAAPCWSSAMPSRCGSTATGRGSFTRP